MQLSQQQQDVLNWVTEGRGSLQLIARAGCGKTFTLLEVVKVIAQHKLGDVAIMAYNKAIAEEIKGKLIKAGVTDWKVAQAGTVHSFGFSAWRKSAPGVTVEDRKVNRIIDDLLRPTEPKDRARLADYAGPYPVLETCRAAVAQAVSLAKQRGFGHLEQIENRAAWFDLWEHFGLDDIGEGVPAADIIEAAINVYKHSLSLCHEIIDFNDMILAPLVYKSRFWGKQWILLDEAQDTNPVRRALALAMLKAKTGRMIFVGDDRQAIYGFTGADSDSMAQLKASLNAETLPLTVTYRCPKVAVRLAQALVPDIEAHSTATEGVHRAISYPALLEGREKLNASDAILCRKTAPLVELAYALLRQGTPCRIEGRDIGVGLIKLATRWKVEHLSDLIEQLDIYRDKEVAKWQSKDKEEMAERVAEQVETLKVIIDRCTRNQRHTVNDLIADIRNLFGDTPDGELPKVTTLCTIHKSKGREWPRVFILGRAEYMPSPWARKPWQQLQEQNLEYVALTRVQRELIDVAAKDSEHEAEADAFDNQYGDRWA